RLFSDLVDHAVRDPAVRRASAGRGWRHCPRHRPGSAGHSPAGAEAFMDDGSGERDLRALLPGLCEPPAAAGYAGSMAGHGPLKRLAAKKSRAPGPCSNSSSMIFPGGTFAVLAIANCVRFGSFSPDLDLAAGGSVAEPRCRRNASGFRNACHFLIAVW